MEEETGVVGLEDDSLRRSRCASSAPMRLSMENLEDLVDTDDEAEEEEEVDDVLVAGVMKSLVSDEDEEVAAAAAAAAAAAEVMTAAAAADVKPGSNSRFCAATIACSAIFRCSLKMRLAGGCWPWGGGGGRG